MKERIVWLDYGKAIAIYLVVLAHTALYKPAEGFIYTFHMPFFFFMSGYLFSYSKYPSYMEFVKRRFRQLLVPYVVINMITYLLWLLVLRNVGSDAGEDVGALSPLIAAVTVNATEMVHDVPLWFLAALFMVENLYYLLYRNARYRVVVTLLLLLLAVLNNTYNTVRLPFCIDISLVALLFYRLGNVMREKGNILFKWYLFVLSAVVTVAVFMLNGKVAMHANYYNNIFLFIAGGVAGCYSMAYICKLLQLLCGDRALVQTIARNTLPICVFHLTVFAVIKGIMLYLLGLSPDILSGTFLPNALFALLSMAVCLLIAKVVNRFLPFVLGK